MRIVDEYDTDRNNEYDSDDATIKGYQTPTWLSLSIFNFTLIGIKSGNISP